MSEFQPGPDDLVIPFISVPHGAPDPTLMARTSLKKYATTFIASNHAHAKFGAMMEEKDPLTGEPITDELHDLQY